MTSSGSNYISIDEHEESVPTSLSFEEVEILQSEFKSKIDLIIRPNGQYVIKAHEYVGHIVLPGHIIEIRPKIKGINFVNMVRYALDLPKVHDDDITLRENGDNYFDLLVSFLIEEIKILLDRGLYNSYVEYEENLHYVRGKILFKENYLSNYNRPDRVYCQFSELTPDVLENRIIKYTIFHLLSYEFIDANINSTLSTLYRRFDNVELVQISRDAFNFISYTSINDHYHHVLVICEMILSNSSLDILKTGSKTVRSFLIDMNILFERFVGKILQRELGEKVVALQEYHYPQFEGKKLQVKPDIILRNKIGSIIVLDTKYRNFIGMPNETEVAQMVLYCVSTQSRKCALIYSGLFLDQRYYLKEGIEISTISFDLSQNTADSFNANCTRFLDKVRALIS